MVMQLFCVFTVYFCIFFYVPQPIISKDIDNPFCICIHFSVLMLDLCGRLHAVVVQLA